MSIPTLQVPVTVFLDLVRSYTEVPQELVNRQTYMEAVRLEKRAYRKYLTYKRTLANVAPSTTKD